MFINSYRIKIISPITYFILLKALLKRGNAAKNDTVLHFSESP
jgi:hypothetical protein